jgi:hypothetical protein
MSFGLVGLNLNIHVLYGASLICSGLTCKLVLISLTTPSNGACKSEPVLTDSTNPQGFPAVIVAPISGNSTKTISPNKSCA